MPNGEESTFLDAGLFIGALMKGDKRHIEARPIVESARRGDFAACTSVGVLSEVYAALTWAGAQPPQSPLIASHAIRLLIDPPSSILVLTTNLDAGFIMLEILETCRLTARRTHDARHAATALANGVTKVYTYDIEDWLKFESEGIKITGPLSVIKNQPGF
ncbi:MAG: type II toxin-antitoxin system VapC family toxin [Chloroflexota bacterium]|nr:type II toxin-antitoxin system VapC family toxin [Chloroflexota bacterium]